MHYQIVFQPSYALLIVGLDTDERVRAQAGAIVSMSASIQIETRAGDETLVFCGLTSTAPGSEATLAPALPGDIAAIDLSGDRDLMVQTGSYMASDRGIEVNAEPEAGATTFTGEGGSLLRLHGAGTAFVSSYGALHLVELTPGQAHAVDTGHVVAFDSGMANEIQPVGSNWKTTPAGGEGHVVTLTGPGRLWLQTRSPGALVEWISSRIPSRR